MYALKNKVQLIGTVTDIPKIEILENNKKQATLILATTEKCKNEKGKVESETMWHHLVAIGNSANLIEKYVERGHEIAIEGKLTYRTIEDEKGRRFKTEVQVLEILLLTKTPDLPIKN